MKLKYMPMKSRCQRAQHLSLRQSSEMKSSCCQNAGPLLKVPVRQFDGKNKMHKKFIYTQKPVGKLCGALKLTENCSNVRKAITIYFNIINGYI